MRLHQQTLAEVWQRLNSAPEGLTAAVAHSRLEEFGPNRITTRPPKNWLKIWAAQYFQFFALLLEVAAGLAFVAHTLDPGQGNDVLAWAILGAVVVNASFSFWQEFRADQAMAALLKMIPTRQQVLRDGRPQEIEAEQLVPGDVLLLEEGDRIPADALLMAAEGLALDLSALNGESTPAQRRVGPDPSEQELEAHNLVFAGTTVLSGHGRAVVFATGAATEFGRIATLTRDVQKIRSPMQQEIISMSRILTTIALSVGALFLILGVASGRGWLISSLFALSLIVANVPEGLLPTITLALSLASQRMARRNALVKNLDSVETLGSATVICTDKTGTLTRNQMTLKHFWLPAGEQIAFSGEGYLASGDWQTATPLPDTAERLCELVIGARLNCRAHLQPDKVSGDPTELALLAAAGKVAHTLPDWHVCGEIPFSSERRMMSTLLTADAQPLIFSKGAHETILPLCSHWREAGGGAQPLDQERRTAVLAAAEAFESQAFRVLALAVGQQHAEQDLTLLGLAAIMDLPRPEVAEAIARCNQAGVRVMMITGDHPRTARAVAAQIGLRVDRVLTGQDLRSLPETTLAQWLAQEQVLFARMESSQKLLIASLLQRNGEVVAMTGDGVNDAPALRKADIGIAMGLAGTDVTREAADMILLDDNFHSIVAAIEEGRTVYFNIKKFCTYHLTSNMPELIPYILAFFLQIPLPLSVIQILSIDLASDMLPGIALGSEPPEQDIMHRPPVASSEKILDREVFWRGYLLNGQLEVAGSMFAFLGFLFLHGWHYGDLSVQNTLLHRQAMTMTLLGALSCQMLNALSLRSYEFALWRVSFFSNPFLLGALVFDLIWAWALLHLPVMQLIFKTAYVPWQDLWLLLPFPLLVLIAHESWKGWRRHQRALAHVA